MAFKDYPDDDCIAHWQAEIEDVKPLSKNTHKTPDPAPKHASTSIFDDPIEADDLPLSTQKNATADISHESFIEKLEAAWLTQPASTPHTPSKPSATQTVRVHQNSSEVISGSANGIDQRTLKKLSTGQIAFKDRLDLHGFYETQAWAAVQDFLHESYANENRCVLIIHGKGKGYGEKSDMGIIKSQMANWLTNHPRVLAFHTAHKKDGGRGAIYVYLKRQK